jgi:hypothetical protein
MLELAMAIAPPFLDNKPLRTKTNCTIAEVDGEDEEEED